MDISIIFNRIDANHVYANVPDSAIDKFTQSYYKTIIDGVYYIGTNNPIEELAVYKIERPEPVDVSSANVDNI